MMNELPGLPVFICYRQADGKDAAARIYEMLNDSVLDSVDLKFGVEQPHKLDVYFDQTSSVGADWTDIHEPYLKRARAFIIVCTPGVRINEGENDWVYKEIDHWLDRADQPPILIDVLGEDERYVPESILARWPNSQRILLIPEELDRLDAEALGKETTRLKNRIMSGIVSSNQHYLKEELNQQKRHSRHLKYALLGTLFLAGLSFTFGLLALSQKNKAETAKLAAIKAEKVSEGTLTIIKRMSIGRSALAGKEAHSLICNEAVSVTRRLSDPQSETTREADKARFLQLYYGEMNLLEISQIIGEYDANSKRFSTSPIESAMVIFNRELNSINDKIVKPEQYKQLEGLSDTLENECKTYLAQF